MNFTNSYQQRFKTPQERFFEKIAYEPNCGCWLWMGATGQARYGSIEIDYVPIKAHRYSWEIHNGRKVSDGMEVCHSCDVPSCVNPDHLWIGTHKDNMDDLHRKGYKRILSGKAHGRATHGKYFGRYRRLKDARAAQYYWGA